MIKSLLIVGLLLTGATQASARSLVGKWDCEARDGPNMAIRMLLDYRQSGQFYHLANVAVGDRSGRMDGSVALNGNWKRNHSTLKETVTGARMRSLKVNGQDISKTPIGRHMAKSLPKDIAGSNPTSVSKVRYLSNTKIQLTSGRTTATCTKR
jgi:hypothetical protein